MGGGYPKDLNVASEPFWRVTQAHMDVFRQCAAQHATLVHAEEWAERLKLHNPLWLFLAKP